VGDWSRAWNVGFESCPVRSTFKQNVALGNGDRGIEAAAGDADAGGN
jgi:hypothetical protein